jgi:hypothetical protein
VLIVGTRSETLRRMPFVSGVEAFLARGFRPFAKVEPREAITTGVMTIAAFLLLTAYYLLKTVREPLILLHGGAEVKLYARAAQAVLMVGVVHVYGEIAQRAGRHLLTGFADRRALARFDDGARRSTGSTTFACAQSLRRSDSRSPRRSSDPDMRLTALRVLTPLA